MPPRSADEIMREMRQIRRELRQDVAGIVDSAQTIVDHAQDMTDWRFYVRNYPLACLGAALAAGYFLIPTRVKVVDLKGHDVAPAAQPQAAGSSSFVTTLLTTAGGLATSLVLQGVSAFAQQQLESVLKSSLDSSVTTGFNPKPSQNGKNSPFTSYESHT